MARVDALASHCTLVTHSEGDLLWEEGAPARVVALVQRGLVQVLRRNTDGADATLALLGPRECAGLTAVLEDGAYPAALRAVSAKVESVLLDGAALRGAMEEDLSLAHAVNTALLEHTHVLRAKIHIMTAGDVPRRLAALFVHLASRFGDQDAGGRSFIPLVLTRRMLAGLVGAREETVIRALSRWEKEGLLVTGAGAFELDAEALRALLP